MQPPVKRLSPLSVHRTFVVQFRTETDAAQGHVVGRIEHVTSGQAAAFQSWVEMQTFMVQILLQEQTQPPPAP